MPGIEVVRDGVSGLFPQSCRLRYRLQIYTEHALYRLINISVIFPWLEVFVGCTCSRFVQMLNFATRSGVVPTKEVATPHCRVRCCSRNHSTPLPHVSSWDALNSVSRLKMATMRPRVPRTIHQKADACSFCAIASQSVP